MTPLAQIEAAQSPERSGMIYVASRASIPERSSMWRRLRSEGHPIISSWIDEAGEGETVSFAGLWLRIQGEIIQSSKLVLYAEADDFPLKGALIEVGMALALGRPVVIVLPGVVIEGRTSKPLGSWIQHPHVVRIDNIEEALAFNA